MPQLVAPAPGLHAVWLECHHEWGPGLHEDGFGLRATDDVRTPAGFASWVHRRRTDPHCTNWWIVEDGRVLGGAALRHRLDERTGHVGYGIRPSARRRGVASWALRQLLDQAWEREIGRVLLVCAADNIASARTAERAGGVFEGERDGARRYWFAPPADL
ncbi:GNAT family N-acetyltransferase [Actinoplanes sp. N902-109]|uniref:GNAT family N-acetyltransferase n=1 Tax=Actinoplanes sp. (strain N902-109) TaxID=649831 RepID=UPI000329590B|nr:GNAT family N-acetyltransferase [Actinoplanes sp. N902-109]AGL20599.1 GCN5-related N-acetyltransferase [Actinoplanes sp. N902-109]